MFITLATDLVLKRQSYVIMLVDALKEHLQYQLLFQVQDERERIVNREGKVVSRWRN